MDRDRGCDHVKTHLLPSEVQFFEMYGNCSLFHRSAVQDLAKYDAAGVDRERGHSLLPKVLA